MESKETYDEPYQRILRSPFGWLLTLKSWKVNSGFRFRVKRIRVGVRVAEKTETACACDTVDRPAAALGQIDILYIYSLHSPQLVIKLSVLSMESYFLSIGLVAVYWFHYEWYTALVHYASYKMKKRFWTISIFLLWRESVKMSYLTIYEIFVSCDEFQV